MFARIVRVRDNKVFIDGVEYTLDEALKLDIVKGVGKDEDGNTYVILSE